MPKYYVGITIGPIIETLCMASRPASLWCASAVFSWFSEDICNKAIDIGGEIISPYYPAKRDKSAYSVTSEAIGKYHDRIIFNVSDDDKESLNSKVDQMITQAKQALANELVTDEFAEKTGKSMEALTELKIVIQNYLQVHYIITEVKEPCNCILFLSPYLDALELCPSFNVDQSIQPVMTLFEGKNAETHNELVKQCFGLKYGDNSIVKQSTDEKGNTTYKVRDIESIVESIAGSNRKIFDYYAIVQADGDSMSKLLENFDDDIMVKRFSEICLGYTSEAAKLINAFGGMTIYAGGDDLLFISPIENESGKNVFELCAGINETFQKLFEEEYEDHIPTLSFGISINYKKFPLYEAFKDTLGILENAKKVKKDGEPKNKTAVHIRKHSGQSLKFRYFNGGNIYEQLLGMLKPVADVVLLRSMLYKISLYRPVIIAALQNDRDLEQLFRNLFDSGYHKTVMDYIQTVRQSLETIYDDVKRNKNKEYLLEKLHDKKAVSDEEITIDLLYSLLRTAKFFSEKKGAK